MGLYYQTNSSTVKSKIRKKTKTSAKSKLQNKTKTHAKSKQGDEEAVSADKTDDSNETDSDEETDSEGEQVSQLDYPGVSALNLKVKGTEENEKDECKGSSSFGVVEVH